MKKNRRAGEDGGSGEQFTLAIFQEAPQILKKAVQAVHMGVIDGGINRTQRLIWNALLKHAHEAGDKHEIYTIPRTLLMDMIDYTSPNRKHLKDSLTGMQKMAVQWDMLAQSGMPGEPVWTSCVLLPTVGFDKDKIYYSYNQQVKPMLFDPKIYMRLDLRIQRRFSLDCAASLYEWCNRYRMIQRTAVLPWAEWRWGIYGQVEETSVLNQYKYFKKDKLLPAIREINEKSDLTIELLETKEGRWIRDLQFVVLEKSVFVVTNEKQKVSEEWDKKMESLGVKERDRISILKKYAPNVLEAHYQYTVERMANQSLAHIKDPGSYFKDALANQRAKVKVVPDEEVASSNGMNMGAEIMAKFQEKRNEHAESMFNEMPVDMQQAFVSEFNDSEKEKEDGHPISISSKSKPKYREMVMFYKWLGNKHWGEPAAQEVLDFALQQGELNKKPR